eukprot:m.65498 g.65498  ORF g.65498 m.65498 type:complete len:249 (+) comp7325_c0_seq2:63-809(+)
MSHNMEGDEPGLLFPEAIFGSSPRVPRLALDFKPLRDIMTDDSAVEPDSCCDDSDVDVPLPAAMMSPARRYSRLRKLSGINMAQPTPGQDFDHGLSSSPGSEMLSSTPRASIHLRCGSASLDGQFSRSSSGYCGSARNSFVGTESGKTTPSLLRRSMQRNPCSDYPDEDITEHQRKSMVLALAEVTDTPSSTATPEAEAAQTLIVAQAQSILSSPLFSRANSDLHCQCEASWSRWVAHFRSPANSLFL